ncbi:MAG TPA: hypothetical protein VF909_13490 [Roseiflexaceae bacterium]
MVVDGDAQHLGRGLDLARHLDVVARRLGIATGMVVHRPTLERDEMEPHAVPSHVIRAPGRSQFHRA